MRIGVFGIECMKIQKMDNKSTFDDKIFAQLTHLFGQTVPNEEILKTVRKVEIYGRDEKWKLDQCIEMLVRFDPSTIEKSTSMQMESNNNINKTDDDFDDDADVLIESDEIQHLHDNEKSQFLRGGEQMHQPNDKRSPWPYKALQKNQGFAAINAPIANQRTFKQPRIISNTIDKHPDMPDIIKHIEQNHRILICLRGPPGSGKSFLARCIIDRTMNADYDNHIFSTDDFFYDKRSKQYIFDRSKLSEAHDRNQFRVSQRAMNGWSPIIVDNTAMKLWEMIPYFKIAVQNKYIIKIIEPNTPWKISVGKLAQRNKHNVSEETIARMLSNYEPGTVTEILRSMQIYNYPMSPCQSLKPALQQQQQQQSSNNASGCSRFTPKEQREQRSKRHELNHEYADNRLVTTSKNKSSEEWPAFEEESINFWNTSVDKNLLIPQRKTTSNMTSSNMYNLLTTKTNHSTTDTQNIKIVPMKHKKDCINENQSFQQIRQIFPQIPIALLWDLFEKCNGDGNWTMDILLNESETKDLQTLISQEDIERDNFSCDCDKPLSTDFSQAVDAIPVEWLKENVIVSRNQRRQKQNTNTNETDVVKYIEKQFVISDSHYSEHTKKIRDNRRATSTVTTDVAGGYNQDTAIASCSFTPADLNINDDDIDEMIEMDLGIELICQLDKQFGSNAFQNETLKDVKTVVLLKKSLAQQLYATWIESFHHQIEEQKQQSIKDDEEFAKELQIKQPPAENSLFEVTQTSNIQNIADMEYTWNAYKCNANEWKQTTREDLAMKMTKAKLCEIFPTIEREHLFEVFTAYGNRFDKTVEFFKENLKSEINAQIQIKGQELIAQVKEQAIQPIQLPGNSKSNKHKIQEYPTLDKLDAEEAKRAALKDFEESRNLAMHHAHLKAECYSKARESFQRKQTGVAYYYTTVANLHNQKIDMYNHKAANAIVEVHSYTQQDPNMLDLHYLHADEAIECLDIYLDRHLKELKDAKRGSKYVFIITGRGLHSAGGFSTIKHRVKCRLKQRTLSWCEVNAGLLKIKLQYISLFTDNINNNQNV